MRAKTVDLGPLASTLQWIARAGSIVSIGLLALFFFGEGFDPSKVAPRQWVGLLFFPAGIVAGLAIGWWREGWGGSIALFSLLAFYIAYGLLLTGVFPRGCAFALFAAPGPLFLIHWAMVRRQPKAV